MTGAAEPSMASIGTNTVRKCRTSLFLMSSNFNNNNNEQKVLHVGPTLAYFFPNFNFMKFKLIKPIISRFVKTECQEIMGFIHFNPEV